MPRAREPTNQGKEPLDVAAREATRWLVEHEHAAFERDCPGDLDHLLLGQGEPANFGFGPDVVDANLCQRRRGPPRISGQRTNGPVVGSMPSRMFSITERCGASESS